MTDAQAARPNPVRLLQITAFVSTVDRFAMPPMLLAIAHELGMPLSRVVQAAGAYYLTYGLMQPVWATLSDRLGLVRTMRVALLLAAAATAASAAAWAAPPLLVGRALAGACFSAAIPGTLVYVGDTVPSGIRQRSITDLMAGVALGTATATAGAGVLADALSWRVMFGATGVGALVLVGLLARLPETDRVRVRRGALAPFGDVLRSASARLVIGLAFVEGAVLLGVLTFVPAAVQAGGVGGSLAGLVTGVYGLAVLAAARVVRRVSTRVPPAGLVAAGAVFLVAACLLAATSVALASAVASCVLLGCAWASMHSTLQTWATQVAPAARATAVALFAAALFAGSATGALLVGGLAERGAYTTIFVLAALTAVPLGFVGTWGRRRFWDPEVGGGQVG